MMSTSADNYYASILSALLITNWDMLSVNSTNSLKSLGKGQIELTVIRKPKPPV